MTSVSRISTLLISLLLLITNGVAGEKRIRLRRQVVAFDDSDTPKHSHGEFLDTLWNFDGIRPDRELGSGGIMRIRHQNGNYAGANSGKKASGKKGGKGSNSGKKSGKKASESYEMSMSMSFVFYF